MNALGEVTNYAGGATKQEGWGHVKFYPYEKGAKKVLAMLKAVGGGSITGFGIVLRILKEGCKKLPLFKRGGTETFTLP